jgi:glucan biosynthesis protein C
MPLESLAGVLDDLALPSPERTCLAEAPTTTSCLSPDAPARYHDLDALRALMMLLVVVGHCAHIYTTNGGWVIRDPIGSSVCDVVMSMLSGFRMQAFFIIAGFCSRLALEHSGSGAFLRSRTVRLGLPLVSSALLLTSTQGIILAIAGVVPLGHYYATGMWVSYLWFLFNLLIYTGLVAGAWRWLRRICPERLPILGGAVVLALPLTGMAARALARVGPDHLLPGQVLELSSLLHFLPFFAFGFVYLSGKDETRLPLLAGGAVLLLMVGQLGTLLGGGKVVNLYCDLAMQWSASLICLYLGRLFLRRRSPVIARLSAASFSIYLFHQPLVIAAGLLLIPLAVAPTLKFLVIASGALGLTLCLHIWVIERSAWLSLLFNGKPLRRSGKQSAPRSPGPGEVLQVRVTAA